MAVSLSISAAAASLVFHAAFLVVLFVLSELSRILGNALKKKKFYRGMYAAMFLLALGQIFYFISGPMGAVSLLLDIAALFTGCLITLYYWSWLPKDLKKG